MQEARALDTGHPTTAKLASSLLCLLVLEVLVCFADGISVFQAFYEQPQVWSVVLERCQGLVKHGECDGKTHSPG